MLEYGMGVFIMKARRWLRAAFAVALVCTLLVGTMSAAQAASVSVLAVKNDYARLRSGVNGDGDVIATLRTGTLLYYLGRNDSMAYVCTESGVRGYVYAGYLTTYGSVRRANVYYVRSSSLPVYSSPSTSASRKGTLSGGAIVLLYDAHINWGLVRSLSGSQGYVLLDGLQRASI